MFKKYFNSEDKKKIEEDKKNLVQMEEEMKKLITENLK